MGRVQKIPKLLKLFNEIELPLMEVLSQMERNSTLLIDSKALLAQSNEIAEKLSVIEQQVLSNAVKRLI